MTVAPSHAPYLSHPPQIPRRYPCKSVLFLSFTIYLSLTHKMLAKFIAATLLLLSATGECGGNGSSTLTVVSLPATYQYLLEAPFSSNETKDFVDSTTTGDSSVNNALSAAQKAAAISYDTEFSTIIGKSPLIRTVATLNGPHAYEMGAWVYDRNEVSTTETMQCEKQKGKKKFKENSY